ncbi:hypothetical protein ACFQX7_15520 [Luedemannella flava]
MPVAAALGPVISQRHGVTQYIGGAVAISAPFVAAWVCHRLDDRRAGQPAYAVVRSGPAPFVGLVVGILCVLGAYGNAERFYGSQFTYEAAVRVIGSGCYEVGDVCVEYAILGRPDDGTRLPLEMFDVAKGLRAGDTLTVRWDKNNYASPVPTTYPVTGLPTTGPRRPCRCGGCRESPCSISGWLSTTRGAGVSGARRRPPWSGGSGCAGRSPDRCGAGCRHRRRPSPRSRRRPAPIRHGADSRRYPQARFIGTLAAVHRGCPRFCRVATVPWWTRQ